MDDSHSRITNELEIKIVKRIVYSRKKPACMQPGQKINQKHKAARTFMTVRLGGLRKF
jgi:hypothetical protein